MSSSDERNEKIPLKKRKLKNSNKFEHTSNPVQKCTTDEEYLEKLRKPGQLESLCHRALVLNKYGVYVPPEEFNLNCQQKKSRKRTYKKLEPREKSVEIKKAFGEGRVGVAFDNTFGTKPCNCCNNYLNGFCRNNTNHIDNFHIQQVNQPSCSKSNTQFCLAGNSGNVQTINEAHDATRFVFHRPFDQTIELLKENTENQLNPTAQAVENNEVKTTTNNVNDQFRSDNLLASNEPSTSFVPVNDIKTEPRESMIRITTDDSENIGTENLLPIITNTLSLADISRPYAQTAGTTIKTEPNCPATEPVNNNNLSSFSNDTGRSLDFNIFTNPENDLFNNDSNVDIMDFVNELIESMDRRSESLDYTTSANSTENTPTQENTGDEINNSLSNVLDQSVQITESGPPQVIDLTTPRAPLRAPRHVSEVIDLVNVLSPPPRPNSNAGEVILLDSDSETEDTQLSSDSTSTTQEKGYMFECPICMQSMVKRELMSTICGHIFCAPCIKKCIEKNKSCPNCRKKLNSKSIHPIYL